MKLKHVESPANFAFEFNLRRYMEATYKAYEEESYKKLSSVISGQKVLPAALFGDMLVGSK